MKFLLVLAAVLSMGLSMPQVSTWTLQDLSAAIMDPETNPALLPYLEDALNTLMADIYAGGSATAATVVVPTEVVQAVTADTAVAVPVDVPAVPSSALVQIIVNVNGEQQGVATAPASSVMSHEVVMDLEQLSAAIMDPATDPALRPALEQALNNLMLAIWNGSSVTATTVSLPAAVPEIARL